MIDRLQVHFPVRAGILERTVGWVRAVRRRQPDGECRRDGQPRRRIAAAARPPPAAPSWDSIKATGGASVSTGNRSAGWAVAVARAAPSDAIRLFRTLFVSEPGASRSARSLPNPANRTASYSTRWAAMPNCRIVRRWSGCRARSLDVPARVFRRPEQRIGIARALCCNPACSS